MNNNNINNNNILGIIVTIFKKISKKIVMKKQ